MTMARAAVRLAAPCTAILAGCGGLATRGRRRGCRRSCGLRAAWTSLRARPMAQALRRRSSFARRRVRGTHRCATCRSMHCHPCRLRWRRRLHPSRPKTCRSIRRSIPICPNAICRNRKPPCSRRAPARQRTPHPTSSARHRVRGTRRYAICRSNSNHPCRSRWHFRPRTPRALPARTTTRRSIRSRTTRGFSSSPPVQRKLPCRSHPWRDDGAPIIRRGFSSKRMAPPRGCAGVQRVDPGFCSIRSRNAVCMRACRRTSASALRYKPDKAVLPHATSSPRAILARAPPGSCRSIPMRKRNIAAITRCPRAASAGEPISP